MPPASGDTKGKTERSGKISTREYDEKWVNPETHTGQPACRSEIAKAERTKAT